MVMWNAIIQKRENAKLAIPKMRAAFPFAVTGREGGLRGREFNVTVTWQVMPRVGRLYTRSQTFSGFQMPGEYAAVEKGNIRPPGAAGGAAAAAA